MNYMGSQKKSKKSLKEPIYSRLIHDLGELTLARHLFGEEEIKIIVEARNP